MEYPAFDKETKLLMLAHQCLEETRARSASETWLKFHKDSLGLTIASSLEYQADGDTMEVRLEGAEASDLLRRLNVSGYVCLDRQDAGDFNTGKLTITDKGLEKIRRYRALEEGLPRVSKKWHVSLLGPELGFVGSKLWRANWQRNQISVRNRRYIALRRGDSRHLAQSIGEYLNVNGRLSSGYRVSRSRLSKDLYGELHVDKKTHQIHAHIGLTAPTLATGCLISVDEMVIGGDIGKKFLS